MTLGFIYARVGITGEIIMISMEEFIDHLGEGETSYSFSCPRCGGSRGSFSVTRLGGELRYFCFRASCGFKGVKKIRLSKDGLKQLINISRGAAPKWKVPDTWKRGACTPEAFSMLEKYNCLDAYKKGLFTCFYDMALVRLVVALEDDKGNIVGGIGRKLDPTDKAPKTLNYGDLSIPFSCGDSRVAVIVEDCFSAIACTNYDLTGLALAGTNMKESYWGYVTQYEKIYIALDKDAQTKGVRLWKKFRDRGFNVKLMTLEVDIKDDITQLEKVK